jgi:TRAP-type uncharacterized transport system fused permease subunit
VWKNIEKAMGEMKNVLVSQLQDPNRTVEEQEKTLEQVFLCIIRVSWYLFFFFLIFQGAFGASIER